LLAPYQYEAVPLEKVRLDFSISFPEEKENLVSKLVRHRLVLPLVLFKKSGTYFLVDGRQRLNAFKKLGTKKVPSLVFTEISEKEALLLTAKLNEFRGLNIVEKALFFEKAREFFSEKELLSLLKEFSLSPDYDWIIFFRNINRLEEELKVLLAEEKLNPKLVRLLASLTAEERKDFLRVFLSLKLSWNEQLRVLEWLIDCKKRYSWKELLCEELKKCLENEDFNKRKKGFFEKLQLLYYPNYYPLFEKVKKLSASVESSGISVKWTPYFEKKELELTLRVKGKKDLDKAFKTLKDKKDLILEVWKEL